NAPINIFLHGGAWRGGLAKDSAYPAELFVHAGAHYVVPDFINVTEANGSLTPMAEQVRRAVAWVYRNAPSFGGDSARIYCSRHCWLRHPRNAGVPAPVTRLRGRGEGSRQARAAPRRRRLQPLRNSGDSG